MKINPKIFKAYDIRGIYPREINESAMEKLAEAIGNWFQSGVFVLARDGRLSSPSLYKSALNGLKQTPKLKIIKVGLATTPMLYFLVNKLNARGGMIVTASHNPKQWNGLKVVKQKAKMVSGLTIKKLLGNSQK